MKIFGYFCLFCGVALLMATLAISGSYSADLKEYDAYVAAGREDMKEPTNPWPIQKMLLVFSVFLFSLGFTFLWGARFIEKMRNEKASEEAFNRVRGTTHPLTGDNMRHWYNVH